MKEKKYFRSCPKCNKILGYTSKKEKAKAERNNNICTSCRAKEVQNRPEHKKKMSKIKSKVFKGSGNPFYGKHHTEHTKDLIRNNTDRSYTQTKEFKEKSKRVGKANGMYGRTYYDVWVQKYGEKIANEKLIKHKKLLSDMFSGDKNPMYGKKSPCGSGNGWSGWYKEMYFRSIKELSYIINVIEKNGYEYRSAETNDLVIDYIDINNTKRTYRADFLVEEKYLIEVKPLKLMNTINNKIKKEAAIKFCNSNGYEYRMVDVKSLSTEEIYHLHDNGSIKFIDRYEKKLKELKCKLTKKKS